MRQRFESALVFVLAGIATTLVLLSPLGAQTATRLFATKSADLASGIGTPVTCTTNGTTGCYLDVSIAGGGGTFTSPILLPDGSASAPSLARAADPTTGLYFGANQVSTTIGGTERVRIDAATGLTIGGSLYLAFGSTAASPRTFLTDDAANTLACRNGTNACTVNIYRTYTDATTNEVLSFTPLDSAFSNMMSILTRKGSVGGTARDLYVGGNTGAEIFLVANGNSYLRLTGSGGAGAGAALPVTDAAQNLGFSSNRWLGGYFSGTVTGGTLNATTAYQFNGNTFGTGTVGPSSPVGTTSTAALVMAGLGGSITTRTGRVEICASGNLSDGTANDGTKAQISYGTGTAPTNGAALTGTQAGSIFTYTASTLAAGATAPYGGCVVVTGLTLNTAYWLDMAFAAITGGTGSLTSAYMAAHDIP